jgi:hypothetical protein
LELHVKATRVMGKIIPNHREYRAMLLARGELRQLYTSLGKCIATQQSEFAEVRKLIRANNEMTGVQSKREKGTSRPSLGKDKKRDPAAKETLAVTVSMKPKLLDGIMAKAKAAFTPETKRQRERNAS